LQTFSSSSLPNLTFWSRCPADGGDGELAASTRRGQIDGERQDIGNSSDYFKNRCPDIADCDYRDTPVVLLGARQAVNREVRRR
jgi:hypothetical protein